MDIIQIECGSYHSAFVDVNGLLYSCGKGQYGQLGTGAYQNELLPTLVQSLRDKVA